MKIVLVLGPWSPDGHFLGIAQWLSPCFLDYTYLSLELFGDPPEPFHVADSCNWLRAECGNSTSVYDAHLMLAHAASLN